MAPRTALVLLAPNADDALHELRVRYFRNLERRMPAHVTMLFPFRSSVDDATLNEITDVCAGLRPFDAMFSVVGRFRHAVVWLRPEPASGFERMSDAVLAAFPDCNPYGGAHSGRTLHLTVASRLRGTESARLADEVGAMLPIADHIDELTLMVEHGGGWRVERSWRFGARS